jgi:hypothetical protein
MMKRILKASITLVIVTIVLIPLQVSPILQPILTPAPVLSPSPVPTATRECKCPLGTSNSTKRNKIIPYPSTITCFFPHSPFTIQRNGRIMAELYLTENEAIPFTTTLNATKIRIKRLFQQEIHTASSSFNSFIKDVFMKETENDGTSVILLIMSPGISSAAAMANAADTMYETCGATHFSKTSNETYSLIIKDSFMYVGAQSIKGLHAGLSTLEYLFVSVNNKDDKVGIFPSLIIPFDTPIYEWRGFHLDVARHFFDYDVLKKLIRKLATMKINVFHLHLTDDQGWRLPKHHKWPLLTEIGSRRLSKNNKSNKNIYEEGYYTKKDIEFLVQLCLELNVNLIPEVDVPGHAGAILASYPSLGCYQPHGSTGSIALIPTKWGELDYALCLKYKYEQVLEFSMDILNFVIDLFPYSSHIHLGGDEIPPNSVTKASLVKFFRSVSSSLEKRNKKVVVWDEVLSLFRDKEIIPNNIIVQAWQSTAKVRETLNILNSDLKHQDNNIQIIASPQEYVYLNKRGTSFDRISKFNPMPCDYKSSKKKKSRLIGASLCLWTEYVTDVESLNDHAFPRTEAFVNAMWSLSGLKNEEKKKDCVFTSMKTYMNEQKSFNIHNIADNDEKTFFWSEGAPSRGDHITIRYHSLQNACGVKILTGGDRKQDKCHDCKVKINSNVYVGHIDRDTGSLQTMFNMTQVKELTLISVGSYSRDWLMVRHMRLILCSETSTKEKLEEKDGKNEL